MAESRNRPGAVCGENRTYSSEGEVSPGNRSIDSNYVVQLSVTPCRVR
jgi:hypothetical protein